MTDLLHRQTEKSPSDALSKQELAEAKLAESEDWHRIIFEKASEGIFVMDAQGILIMVNEEFAHSHGYAVEEMKGMSPRDFDLEVSATDIANRMRRLFSGETLRFKVVHRHRNGRLLHYEVTANGILLAGSKHAIAFHRDITERKQAEESLARSERFLKTIIDTEPECIKMLDVDCNLLMMNPAGLKMIDADSFEQIKGQCVCPLITAPHRDAFIALTKQVFNGISDTLEFEIVGLKGRHIWLETHAVPFTDEQGKIVALLAVTRDITERKRAEEERLNLEQQFQHSQKLESLGVLSGGIAHVFNNILAVIMGYCSLTKMDYENAGMHIAKIEQAAERGAALCRQMLAYAGKAQVTMGQVNMRTLVDEMITMLKATIPQNVAIKPDLLADIPSINGDASQIRQVVMNLIINASEAIGTEQGEVKVSLARATIIATCPEKDYHGMEIPSGCYICLEVTDNGSGIDEETKWRIFEPFYTTKFTGRGLGMSAVLGIIKAHNGALQLESRLGHGTTFKIYLPVQTSDCVEEKTLQQPGQADSWTGSGTILLVDDEDSLLLALRYMLKKLGFTVIETANGEEALEAYQKNAAEITMVLTDMGMPVMNGYELFCKLKQLDPQLPIIISSGFGDDDIASRIPREAMAGMLNKPYTFEQLREVLRGIVVGTRHTIP